MNIATTPHVAPMFPGLPKQRPSVGPNRAAAEGDEGFDWESLVPLFVHPIKVEVIEAMHWIGQPLSATELATILASRKYKLGVVAYHVSKLAKLGVIEVTHERQVRGARETYYFFPSGS